MSNDKLKWAVLQPLIGGMAIGAEQAIGHKPEFILSSEGIKNEAHITNYWPQVPYLTMNADGEFSTPEMKETFDKLNNDIRLTIAVPICAGLSSLTSNNNKNGKARGADAVQNDNMYNVTIQALDLINPDVHVFENAPSLYTKLGEPVAEKLKKIGLDRNYSMSLYKTDTFLHGIPQHRHRTFAYFWKNDSDELQTPIMPYYKADTPLIQEYLDRIPEEATHQNLNGFWTDWQKRPFIDYMKDALGADWRTIMLKEKTGTILWYLLNTNTLPKFKDWCKVNCDEKTYEWVCKKVDHAKFKVDQGKNYWGFEPCVIDGPHCNAITAKLLQQVVHPTEDRQYKVREAMWLMGLPNDFNLVANPGGSYPENHIAQNVPVCTARDSVLNGVKFINGELDLVNLSFVKQNNEKQKVDTPLPTKTTLSDFFS